jgi:hypothetical protein
MAVVDAAGSTNLLVTGHMHSGQFQDLGRADEANDVVVVEMQSQTLSD